MERGGGFHGYQKLPKSSSGMRLLDIANDIDGNSVCTVREQDRFMPIANVIRIMRKIIPGHGKISDDAKETIQECVSEYISFITSEANDRCQREQRKTITAEDVLWAMSKLGFDDYIGPLTTYLQRYREFEGDRGSLRGDPFVVKRSSSIDLASLQTSAASYGSPVAAFHHMAAAAAAAHHHHQVAAAGLFVAAGGPPPGGPGPTASHDYFRDGHGGVSSPHQNAAAMATTFDPYASYK